MMPSGPSSSPAERDPGALLRARGLRVTPQRRAILGAFSGAATEHLSADEVHARASATVPEISRGTVYAALAELTELGLLAAVGSPEPVRYETNAADHQHFRCRICLRLYDIDLPEVRTDPVSRRGFLVERTTMTVEGVCADCVDYEAGLREGAQASVDADAGPSSPLPPRLACERLDSPVGDVWLAATPDGMVRVVFDDHVDVPALRTLARRRTGGSAARAHLDAARAYVSAYFAGEPLPTACTVDWQALADVDPSTLRDVQAVPAGADRSYERLSGADARTQGLTLGTNPLAVIVPCHRITRGREVPDAYVGGAARKRWLRGHERP
jgi:Fe2+ or Zn2+ uptake regulation protein/O6-methylguanine-DNA--protein-cysteine methyltransferase